MPRVTKKSSKAAPAEVEAVKIAVDKNCRNKRTEAVAPSPSAQNQWILVAPRCLTQPNGESAGTVELVKLRNPRTAQEAVYGFTSNNLKIVELQRFLQGKRSWFVGDAVQSDGSMCIATPVDPLFLALPYLHKANYASPLDQILVDDKFPQTDRLLQCLEARNLNRIAEMKQTPSITAWKFDEEKTLKWLSAKHEKLTRVLEKKGINASTVARSAAYISAEKICLDEYKRYAFGVLCDYLSPAIAKRLEEHLKLPEKVQDPAPVHEPAAKRVKLSTETNEPLEDYSKYFDGATNENKEKAGNAKTKALANAAKGSKSITSFFKKK